MAKGETVPAGFYRVLKWGAVVLGVLLLLILVLAGVVAAPDLFRSVPEPEVVGKVAVEKKAAGLMSGIGARIGTQAGDSTLTLTLTRSDGTRMKLDELLIPDLSAFPKELRARREKINADFTSLTHAMARYQEEAHGMTYEESEQRIISFRNSLSSIVDDVFGKITEQADKEHFFNRLKDPNYGRIRVLFSDCSSSILPLSFECGVRHEKWDLCASLCEGDNFKKWPEAVYYWRRKGGWRGYWHILGGSVYIRSIKYPMFDRVRHWLPYTGSEISPEWFRSFLTSAAGSK